MQKSFLKKINLPDKPGVYFFMDAGKILYIGKATSLKDRVKSYFSKDLIKTRGPLITDMVFKANDLKWEETDSVLEALILEANLIKKHQPYYNSKEKDDKSFNYVCITDEELPKVVVVRGRDLLNKNKKIFGDLASKKSFYNFTHTYGPYPHGGQLKEALKIIRKIFPFMDNKTKNYHEFYKQINLAPDPEKKKEYLRNIKNIKLFFEGKKKSILKSLEKDMKMHAKGHKFEKAGEVKRQIFALNHINDVSLIKDDPVYNSTFFRIEAYDVAHMSGKNMVGVMVVVENGLVNKKEYRKFKIKSQQDANDTGALREVLERRFAHNEWVYPKLVVVDGSKAQLNTAKKVFAELGIEIPLVGVVKDERHRPKSIIGNSVYAKKHEKDILLANAEAHRFAISYHKDMRAKAFLNK